MKVVLFDIDGTLMLTGGAGVRAMGRAFDEIFSVQSGLQHTSFPGNTDQRIIVDALERIGRIATADEFDRFRQRYCELLSEEIHQPGPRKGLMPGIRDLLDGLHVHDAVFLGLLTGNFAASARIKLEYFDVWRYFPCGAFADDALNRNDLGPIAMARARECGAAFEDARDVLVVGDTPLDVACAHAAGALAVGVATGSFSADALRQAGADVAFDDLSDTAAFLRLLA